MDLNVTVDCSLKYFHKFKQYIEYGHGKKKSKEKEAR